MRYLIYTDLQAGEGSERCFHDPTLPLQRWRVKLFFEVLLELFEEACCDGLWDLGDTFDDRNSIPVPTLDNLFACLEWFKVTCDNNLKLVGNHDQHVKSGKVHSGRAFTGVFQVYDTPVVREICGVRVLLCPYPDEAFDLETWLDENLLKDGTRQLVLGHFQVEGTRDRDGRILKGGVHVGILKRATLVLLGHVHHPQSITQTIHYIGSPFQQDFGEAGEDKRVALLDLPELTLQWAPIYGFPVYKQVTIDEWLNVVDSGPSVDIGTDEDRYRVVLNSQADVERYFNHPKMRQAKPIYDGIATQLAAKSGATKTGPVSFDASDVIQRFFKQRPPAELHGLSADEFLQVGVDLVADSVH